MELTADLVSQFAKIVAPEKPKSEGKTVTGTAKSYDGKIYVQLDGSDQLTPIASSTVGMKDGDRVTVLIKDHSATVNGNTSSPSAGKDDIDKVDGKVDIANDSITELYSLVAEKVTVDELDAAKARIDKLEAEDVTINGKLDAVDADIEKLHADKADIDDLKATEAEIENLKVTKLDTEIADIKFATIKNLESTDANIHNLQADYGDFKDLTTEKLTAADAEIKRLDVEKLTAKEADLKYANIDFANIGKAAIENFFSKSGMIGDLVVGDGTITGTLVGVTIKGDLIEGGTVKADKLVVQGEDGLYYKLNVSAETVGAEQTEYNSLNGSIITAKSITAEKVNVHDLVAFGATIGGFKITDSSIYSGVKESIDNTTRGLYMDDKGQLSVGDGSNFLRYFKADDGTWKLEISAQSLKISASDKTIEEELEDIRDEVTTIVTLESTRGVMFKNSAIATSILATVYRGSQQITTIEALTAAMGDTAHLEWGIKHLGEEEYTPIPSDDSRLSSNGFILTFSPGDVDVQAVLRCEVIA